MPGLYKYCFTSMSDLFLCVDTCQKTSVESWKRETNLKIGSQFLLNIDTCHILCKGSFAAIKFCIHLSIQFFFALFACPSVSPSVCMSVCPSVCLSNSQCNSHLTQVKARVALTMAKLQIAQLCTIHLKTRKGFFLFTRG